MRDVRRFSFRPLARETGGNLTERAACAGESRNVDIEDDAGAIVGGNCSHDTPGTLGRWERCNVSYALRVVGNHRGITKRSGNGRSG